MPDCIVLTRMVFRLLKVEPVIAFEVMKGYIDDGF